MKTLLDGKWTMIVLIAGIIFWIIGNYVYTPIMAFAGGILGAVIILALIHILDNKMLGKVDTYEEIVEKQNLPYAIYFLSVTIGVCTGVTIAFLVFLRM